MTNTLDDFKKWFENEKKQLERVGKERIKFEFIALAELFDKEFKIKDDEGNERVIVPTEGKSLERQLHWFLQQPWMQEPYFESLLKRIYANFKELLEIKNKQIRELTDFVKAVDEGIKIVEVGVPEVVEGVDLTKTGDEVEAVQKGGLKYNEVNKYSLYKAYLDEHPDFLTKYRPIERSQILKKSPEQLYKWDNRYKNETKEHLKKV